MDWFPESGFGELGHSEIDIDWLDAFPVFKEAVVSIAQRTQAPVELVLAVVLAVIALVSQYLIDVKRPWGSVGPTSLIIFLIALSGERKTTVEEIASCVLKDFESQREKLDLQKVQRWEALWGVWEKKKKKIQRMMLDEALTSAAYEQLESTLLDHASSEPTRPWIFRMIHQDVTSSAMVKALTQDCPSAALFTSEGDIALRGAINSLGMMNALWSGSGVEVGRASTGRFSLANARLSIGIGVQPGVFQEYLEKKGDLGKASGFFARSLIFYPKSTQGTRFISGVASVSLEQYFKRIKELLEENVRKFDARDASKKIVGFSVEAGEELVRLSNRIEKELQEGGEFARAREHASKLIENISRVVALLHFFETGGSEISLSELLAAEKIVMGCSGVYKQLFSFSSQVVADAEALISWLREKCEGSVFRKVRKNDILKFGPRELRRARRRSQALEYLMTKGLVKEVVCGRVAEIELV
ncbi:TPA: YfjI family protein [Pseudomonas aeruginosa]|uniref:YfjI family protein n=1 Tax=Pseudomonas aeruginosa TaxID=287 RepID=UPI0018C7E952|nr:YfjI family protein [Pseudomonas aeruginosa]MBG4707288.1 DUF3987 domain-containing protein [Pseudomonas aeruginosa]MBI8511936.1 DUF3987 domain-containing protein [Pseudomonas aeruginosa]HCL3287125.1 DUF3987 domain-containing protein [Pseudomonas aeruginosa]HEJ3144904.1 DUF3987 domain-containing protein [Pseudomonas aeruginosa]HEK1282100.1 DUF3987 domain-containing protein [Pseudomonas aeruginosa]